MRKKSDNNMNHLKEFIRGWIQYQTSEFDCSDMTEEEVFEIVMENVCSMIEDYGYQDFIKEGE
jgi:hypothetical protein